MAVVIAEIGCNHKGEFEIAEELIKVAAQFCKIDIVKFQKRCNKELLTPAEYNILTPIRQTVMVQRMVFIVNSLSFL